MKNPPEPIRDIAHLGHVEIFTPKPEASLAFFENVLGMTQVATQGASVFLRGWGDYDLYTLKLTASNKAGLGHVGWRTVTPHSLERQVESLKKNGCGKGWVENEFGHGPAWQFTDPDNHLMEVYYESEKYHAPSHLKSRLINQPQKYPARGANIQRLDHVNLMCSNVTPPRDFLIERLGFKLRENIILDNGIEAGAWLSVTPLAHDIAYTRDFTNNKGRLHHIAFWLESRDELLRAADILKENDIFIEAGPNKHGITQAIFLYLYEPGGNRVELFSGGYLIFAPDFKPVTWNEKERGTGVHWGGVLPESFRQYGTPVADLSQTKTAVLSREPVLNI